MRSSPSVGWAAMRGHREGSICRRKDRRWQVAISCPDGRRYSYLPRTATRAEARALLRDETARRDAANAEVRAEMLLGPFLRRWLADFGPSLRPGTLRHYTLIVEVAWSPR